MLRLRHLLRPQRPLLIADNRELLLIARMNNHINPARSGNLPVTVNILSENLLAIFVSIQNMPLNLIPLENIPHKIGIERKH